MQELSAHGIGYRLERPPRPSSRAHRRKPLDVTFARRLHAYEGELAERESRAAAEAQDLQLLSARVTRVRTAFERQRLVAVYQPIVDLGTGATCGYEALSRFHLDPLRPPDQWFAEADAAGLGPELEMHAIRSAIKSRHGLPAGTYLSVNVSPKTLLSRAFAALVQSLDGEPLDYDELKRAIDRFRARGVRLAIDDLGTGFASFMHIVKLLPEFMKLDLSLTRDIDRDAVKQALTAALVGFAAQIDAHLIAEGVETAEEMQTLTALGVECAQGYYLGAPAPPPA